MNTIDRVALLAELDGALCELNHKNDPSGVPRAIDFLVVPIGDSEGVVVRELTIPICAACARTLADEASDWTLLYCLDCCASQWIARSLARLDYVTNAGLTTRVLWLKGCPSCGGRLKGLWFG